MARFRSLLAEVMTNGPWSVPSDSQLDSVAARLDAADIADLIDALDDLSREKEALPDWDGDSQDDVARVQEIYTRILRAMTDRHRAGIQARLGSCEPLTAQYLALALAPAS